VPRKNWIYCLTFTLTGNNPNKIRGWREGGISPWPIRYLACLQQLTWKPHGCWLFLRSRLLQLFQLFRIIAPISPRNRHQRHQGRNCFICPSRPTTEFLIHANATDRVHSVVLSKIGNDGILRIDVSIVPPVVRTQRQVRERVSRADKMAFQPSMAALRLYGWKRLSVHSSSPATFDRGKSFISRPFRQMRVR